MTKQTKYLGHDHLLGMKKGEHNLLIRPSRLPAGEDFIPISISKVAFMKGMRFAFMKTNMQYFVKAFGTARQKHWSLASLDAVDHHTEHKEFIEKARKTVGYSDKTASCDIYMSLYYTYQQYLNNQ